MKIWEAYDVMHTAMEDVSRERLAIARRAVYEKIREYAAKLSVPKDVKDDVAQEVFLNLVDTGTPLNNKTVAAANAAIRTAVRRGQADHFRAQKKEQEARLQQSANEASAEADDVPDLHQHELEGRQNPPDSKILGDYKTRENYEPVVYGFILSNVMDDIYSRSPARERGRAAIGEMRALTNSDLQFDNLVDEEVDESASDEVRKQARRRIHKRHQRARDRIGSWICGQKQKLDKNCDPEKLEIPVTEFDLQLLKRAVEGLRTRQSSSDSWEEFCDKCQ